MNSPFSWLASAADRVNPIAVKEFRQAVRSRLVISILMLFLILNLVVVGGYLTMSTNPETSVDGGRSVFMGLLGILAFTCLAFVPLYSAVRLSLERNDSNIDLFFVTTITPGAIIRGKYFAATALTALIFSSCTPFITLTYLLRGIDLPTIFLLLAMAFLFCMVGNALGIFAGSISASWFLRGIAAVGSLIALFAMFMTTMGIASTAVNFGRLSIFGSAGWAGVATFLLMEAAAIGALHVFSVAMFSPKLSNRMLVPRLYMTGCWAVTGAVMALWSWCEKQPEPMLMWLIGSGIGCMALMVTSFGERDTWSARVRRTIPRNPLLRFLVFPFYTGSAGGVAWYAALFLIADITTYGFLVSVKLSGGHRDIWMVCGNMLVIFGYVLCYCLTTAAFRPLLLRKTPTVNLPVIAAFLGVAAWLVPYLIAFLTQHEDRVAWYLIASPLILSMTDVASSAARAVADVLLVAWLGASVILSAPWAIGQWRRFVPYHKASDGNASNMETASCRV